MPNKAGIIVMYGKNGIKPVDIPFKARIHSDKLVPFTSCMAR
jgi:hypothetical protein